MIFRRRTGQPATDPSSARSGRPRTAFRFALLGLSLTAGLVFVELLARRHSVAPEVEDPFVDLGLTAPFFQKVLVDGEPQYTVAHSEAYRDRGLTFPAVKGTNTIRVFCLGGSASAGWPHPKEEIYSAYLQSALQRAFPDRHVEVLNVSAHAYAVYRVRLIFEQVLHFDPDLIVIYSGNNEFLEKRKYEVDPVATERKPSWLDRVYTVRALRHMVHRLLRPENSLSGEKREGVESEIYSKVSKAALELRQDPRQFEQLERHYRWCIDSMLRRAEEAGVPVVLLTVPVNLRDWRPNMSFTSLTGADLTAWQRLYAQGQVALLQQAPDDAIALLREASARNPLYAEGYFMLGRAFEAAGRHGEAVEAYTQAKDLDFNPFRAPGKLNQTLRELAERHHHVLLVDAEKAFREASAPRAPGFDLFLDYVHPNKKGNTLIANLVAGTILRSAVLGVPAKDIRFDAAQDAGQIRYDEGHDRKLQRTMMWLYGMMHQYESLVQKAREVQEALGDAALPTSGAHVLGVLDVYLDLKKKRLLDEPIDPAEESRILENVRNLYEQEYKLKPERAVELFQ